MPEPTAQAKDRGVIGLGVVITLVSLIGAFALGDYTVHVIQNAQAQHNTVPAASTVSFDGYAAVGTPNSKVLNIDEASLTSMTFKLTWTDEPPADQRHTNQPDTLSIEVASAFGTGKDQNDKGEVVVNLTAPEKKPWDSRGKPWNVTVTCTKAGDQTPVVPDPLGLRTIKDGGNSYRVEVTIKSFAKK